MNKNVIFALIIFASLFSCTKKEEATVVIPAYVLDKEKFSDLICDFTLAETAANLNIKKTDGLKFDSVYAFNPLLENNVSKELFDTTLAFYSRNPMLFKEVYDLSLEKFSKMQDSRKNNKKTVKDSIK